MPPRITYIQSQSSFLIPLLLFVLIGLIGLLISCFRKKKPSNNNNKTTAPSTSTRPFDPHSINHPRNPAVYYAVPRFAFQRPTDILPPGTERPGPGLVALAREAGVEHPEGNAFPRTHLSSSEHMGHGDEVEQLPLYKLSAGPEETVTVGQPSNSIGYEQRAENHDLPSFPPPAYSSEYDTSGINGRYDGDRADNTEGNRVERHGSLELPPATHSRS